MAESPTNHKKSCKILRSSFLGLLLFCTGVSCHSSQELTSVEEPDRYYTYAGLPEVDEYPNPLIVLYNVGYVVGYDEVRGVPAWVAYRVYSVDEYISQQRLNRFLVDDRTTNRVSHDHYTNSGYDRGHMAPNFAIVTRYGQDAQRETFYMTNIIPQTSQLNRQWWAKLERLVSRDYSEAFDEVWVISGPVFKETGNWIGEDVKIPSHNYMILKVKVDGELWVKSFIVPQDIEGDEPLEPYLVTIRDIEELTNLNFNPLFESQLADSLESLRASELWNR